MRDNRQFVNKEDIKALLTHRANEWKNSGDYFIQSSNLVGALRSDAIELNLPSHNRKACEDLLITINSFFTPQVSLGERCDEIIYLVGKQFSKAASIQYKKLERDIIEKEPVTLGRIFVNSCVVSAKKGETTETLSKRTNNKLNTDLTLTINDKKQGEKLKEGELIKVVQSFPYFD